MNRPRVSSRRRRAPRSQPACASVEAGRALREYADRGVFRGFAGAAAASGRQEFRFRWLADSTFRVVLDPTAGSLTFLEVLPNVPHRSPMDRAFRAFLRDRSSAELPEHRRIDPGRLAVRCRNRGGKVSVALALRRHGGPAEGEDWAYAARKGVSLVNEIFHGFLRGPYHEYMIENFGEPEE